MSTTKTHRVGIVMNGVTGRMGMNQHLLRSIMPIIEQGGVKISPEETIMPDPVLVGRNPTKLEAVAQKAGVERWTTDLDAALADTEASVYFDATLTGTRVGNVERALAAGKHVYCENRPPSM